MSEFELWLLLRRTQYPNVFNDAKVAALRAIYETIKKEVTK